MSSPINHDYAEGKDVSRVISKIETAIGEDEDETVVLMACLSLALMIQHPQISNRQLMDGVLGSSEWIALYLTSLEDQKDGGLPPSKLN